jgi:hypothetical protein
MLTDRDAPYRRSVPLLATLMIAGAVLAFVLIDVWPGMHTATGFAPYYTASRLALHGAAGARLYDDAWFGDVMERQVGSGVRDVFTSVPPSGVLLMLPIAWLPFPVARAVWVGVEAMLLVGALWLIVREMDALANPMLMAGLVAVNLLAAPVALHFYAGQVYVLLLVLHVVAWRALRRDDVRLAGIALGLAMGLKLSGWPIWLLLAARRQWRPLAFGLATIGLLVVSSVWLVDLEAWRVYALVQAPRVFDWPPAPLTAYQTLTGFARHLFQFDAVWNPSPLIHAPALATILTAGVIIAVLAVTIRLRASHVPAASIYVMGLALTCALNPIAEEYHYVLMVLPLCVMWGGVVQRRSLPLALAASMATALIVLAIDYENPALASGWSALLAYPRLYGGLLTWGVLLHMEASDNLHLEYWWHRRAR